MPSSIHTRSRNSTAVARGPYEVGTKDRGCALRRPTSDTGTFSWNLRPRALSGPRRPTRQDLLVREVARLLGFEALVIETVDEVQRCGEDSHLAGILGFSLGPSPCVLRRHARFERR